MACACCMQAPPAKEAVKAAKEVARPGKRKGPLPLWLAEIFVIAGISGLLYAIIRWCKPLVFPFAHMMLLCPGKLHCRCVMAPLAAAAGMRR